MKKIILLPALAIIFLAGISDRVNNGTMDYNFSDHITAAPNIEVLEVMPTNDAGDAVYLTMAPVTSKGTISSLVSVRFKIKNKESKEIILNKIVYECTGNGKNVVKTFFPDDDKKDTIGAGKTYNVQNSREYHELGDVFQINFPFATQLKAKLYFDGFTDPYIITKPLKGYLNQAPGNAYDFPAKTSDLLMNEYWYADAAHGGGGQVFAYDAVVVGWDEENKKWSSKLPGQDADKNENYRVYGKPIYSIGDGEIISYINNWGESPSTSDTGSAGGNSFKINNGKETACYYHMQPGSLNKNFLKIGAKVKKGDFLGLAGNSGNSTGPHLHVHVIADPDKDGEGPFVPLQFQNTYSIGIKSSDEPNPNADWVKLNKTGLPYIADGTENLSRALVWPDAKKPCWYPYGVSEIARHGIPEIKYQEEFNKIWGCGYYPVWVDAYDVNGKTFFNTIFRYNSNNYQVVVRHDMTADKYQLEYDNWVKTKGYRLQQIDNYLDAGKLKIAAIFIKKPGQAQSQPAYHAATPEQHQKLFEDYTGKGYVPVNVSVISVAGKRYYAAFYEKRNVGGSSLKSFLSQQEYQDMFDDMNKKKWEQVYINAYHHDGQTRFSVIWYQNAAYKNWTATRKSSPGSYQEIWENNLNKGMLTRCVTGYDEGGKHWFAGHWAK